MGALLAILLLNVVTNPSNLCAKTPEMFKIICALRWLLRENYQAMGVCMKKMRWHEKKKNGKWAEHKINKVLQENR